MGSKGVALGQLLNRNTSVREVGNQVFDAGDSAPYVQYGITLMITGPERQISHFKPTRWSGVAFIALLPCPPFSIPVQAMLQTLCIRFVEDVLVAQRFSFAYRFANFPA